MTKGLKIMKQYKFTCEYNGKIYDVYAEKDGNGRWIGGTQEAREVTNKSAAQYRKELKMSNIELLKIDDEREFVHKESKKKYLASETIDGQVKLYSFDDITGNSDIIIPKEVFNTYYE